MRFISNPKEENSKRKSSPFENENGERIKCKLPTVRNKTEIGTLYLQFDTALFHVFHFQARSATLPFTTLYFGLKNKNWVRVRLGLGSNTM
jgi:hypothetical protein